LALGKVTNPIALFFLSATLTCALEYLTSYVMEKLFHARWWDYSKEPLNINGRVYIGGFLAFGIASVLLIKFINPFMESRIERIPGIALHVLCLILLAAIVSDIVITVKGFTGFNEKLRDLTTALETAKANLGSVKDNLVNVKESVSDMIHQSRPYEAFGNMKETVSDMKDTVSDKFRSYRYEAYEKFTGRLTHQQKRMLRAFPRFRSTSYNSVMPELRRFIAKRAKRKETSDKK
jgi:uncharacterized membrane protein